jgi:hypothetical protein
MTAPITGTPSAIGTGLTAGKVKSGSREGVGASREPLLGGRLARRPRNLEDTRARGAAMKTIATGYATTVGLAGALALTAMSCSIAQTRAGAEAGTIVSQYCAPPDEEGPDARRFYCRSGPAQLVEWATAGLNFPELPSAARRNICSLVN